LLVLVSQLTAVIGLIFAWAWANNGRFSGGIPNPVAAWRAIAVENRRRQMLLATGFATFGAFFLAVALRGRYIVLFGLMAAALVAHLMMAARIGSKLASQRASDPIAGMRNQAHLIAQTIMQPNPSGEVVGFAMRSQQDVAPVEPVGPAALQAAAEAARELRRTKAGGNAKLSARQTVSELVDEAWSGQSPIRPEPVFHRAPKDERTQPRGQRQRSPSQGKTDSLGDVEEYPDISRSRAAGH